MCINEIQYNKKNNITEIVFSVFVKVFLCKALALVIGIFSGLVQEKGEIK